MSPESIGRYTRPEARNTTIAPLHRAKKAAARLVFQLSPREQITACLLQLHWLPVCWRIQFKLCCINGNCPAYLSDIVQKANACPDHRPRLRLAYIIVIDRLRVTTTSHQVWRARLFLRWAVCAEQTAWRWPRRMCGVLLRRHLPSRRLSIQYLTSFWRRFCSSCCRLLLHSSTRRCRKVDC